MPWIILKDGLVDVKRIVIDERHPGWMHAALRGLALNLGLGVAGRDVTPKAGDLWVGRLPEKGWRDLSAQTGWVRGRISIARSRNFARPIRFTLSNLDSMRHLELEAFPVSLMRTRGNGHFLACASG